MNDRKKVIPMPVPGIGGQQQVQINEMDTIQKSCLSCNAELFDLAYRYRILPSVSMKNPTGKDIPIKVETFICRSCGWEFGTDVPKKQ